MLTRFHKILIGLLVVQVALTVLMLVRDDEPGLVKDAPLVTGVDPAKVTRVRLFASGAEKPGVELVKKGGAWVVASHFDFPADHWVHLRTTNIVESPFDMVRLRTNAARRFKRVENASSMIWKLLRIAETIWRCLKGAELLRDVYDGKKFIDGKIVKNADKVKEVAA